MTIKQVSVFVSNTPGGLSGITHTLADNNIDIRALSIADTADFGILRLIVDEPDKAVSLLRESGIIVTVTDVLAVHIDDEPGGLAKIIDMLGDAGISIEYLYAFVNRKTDGAYVILRIEDNAAAEAVFQKNGIALASPTDLYDL